jgi:hypothetical protein
MKKYPLYRLPVTYMLLYSILIVLSGIWLFLRSQGLGSAGGIVAILQKFLNTPVAESMQRFVEVATPHLFAMGVLIFIIAHFLLFSRRVPMRVSMKLSTAVFVSALLDIAAYGMILSGMVVSGWVKLLAMALFIGLFFLLLLMVWISL